MPEFDAIVIGSGPNGLVAAIELARKGWSVRVYEAQATIGGGMRTQEITLPGFKHDICSAIHPLGMGSPFMSQLPLAQYGLEWIQPDIPLAHPLDNGKAVALYQSITDTANALGSDGDMYRRLITPLAKNWDSIADFALGPFRIPADIPTAIQFGMRAVFPATWLAKLFRGEEAKALLAGCAAHSVLPLDMSPSAAFGLVLGTLGHVVGWPFPKGGAQSIADALAGYLHDLGGEIICDTPVTSLDALPSARAYLFDTSPAQLIEIAGSRIPDSLYTEQVNHYRYGPGVFKVDFALSDPIPWTNDLCKRAGTLHLGGTIDELTRSERLMWEGIHSENPYVIVAQQSLFDDTRAPDGQHTGWAYCHVPRNSTRDMTDIIINQIERFAPGFRDCILETATMHTADFQRYNPNYIGGDINGGVADWTQLFTRPVVRARPYTTPAEGLYLCSSSTPPGGGVHGMCGYHAARAVLWDNRAL